MSLAEYHFPTHVTFGPGAKKVLPELLGKHGLSKPLLVTDAGLAKLPLISDLVGLLEAAGLSVEVFSGVEGNPVGSQVLAGKAAFQKSAADCIVAVGGGAALDVAKVIALMVHHPGELFDYDAANPNMPAIDMPIPPWIAVPTTAGTGSEVGRAAVVSDDSTHAKKIFFSPRLLACEVVADPELTLALPAGVTAATGMDAITHLVEAYLANGFQPLCDGIAREGMRLVSESLAAAVEFAKRTAAGEALSAAEQEQHLEARGKMLNAALMGGVAFQKGLGVTHSCAHSLSTVCDLHHGLANGILIPYTMEFNGKGVPERLADLAQSVRAKEHSAAGFVQWLEELKQQIGIPKTLSEVGVQASHMDALLHYAMLDGCHLENPIPVSADDFRAIFKAAIGL